MNVKNTFLDVVSPKQAVSKDHYCRTLRNTSTEHC